ncbi:peptidoglycan-recognition protein SC2-like [Culicoides brevitarsis]|uniref:peptidoglycan-recognition protein SC2-like n=1 Tax=Culicoides brevitarsis TaxID=469753 RepID=UPI00307BDBC8
MKLFVVLFGIFAAVSAQCPSIVTRTEWGAIPASSTNLPTRPAPWYVIHHTAGTSCSTKTTCSAEMRAIQHLHINTNGWADIGYNFLIGGDGLVYEGRGWGKQGAHAPGYNDKSVGISFMGTFTSGLPTSAALQAAKDLISCGVTLGHVAKSYSLIGHRQAVATECPGNKLFDEIKTWPNFKP